MANTIIAAAGTFFCGFILAAAMGIFNGWGKGGRS